MFTDLSSQGVIIDKINMQPKLVPEPHVSDSSHRTHVQPGSFQYEDKSVNQKPSSQHQPQHHQESLFVDKSKPTDLGYHETFQKQRREAQEHGRVQNFRGGPFRPRGPTYPYSNFNNNYRSQLGRPSYYPYSNLNNNYYSPRGPPYRFDRRFRPSNLGYY